jgi:hypothetical protein
VSSVTAARPVVARLAVVAAVPAWFWVTALVGVSAAVRYWLASRMVAPWIMIDEIVYSELAKSFAETGSFRLRDQPASGAFGVVYPVLIAPAYWLFESLPTAYEAVKVVNSIVISLVAVPVYLLARMLVRPALALVAAVLAVAVPSMIYAGTVMTENAFYPAFMLAVLLFVRALDRPTPGRTLAFLGAIALAYLTRAQAIAFLPAAAVAPLALVALQGRIRSLTAYRWYYALPAAAFVLLVLVQLARGSSLDALLGAYNVTAYEPYDWREVARWTLWHASELVLYLAVVPAVALVLLLAVARRLPRLDQAFLVASVALVAVMLVQVAAFASRYALRIEERNLFYVAPLFIVALVLWVERGLPRRWLALPAVAAVAVLPALIPFERFMHISSKSDTLLLIAWWRLSGLLEIAPPDLWRTALLLSAAAAALALVVPRVLALVLPTVVLAAFVAVTIPVEGWIHGFRASSEGALFQGTSQQPDWIDRAVGRDADVAVVWSGAPVDPFVVYQGEFFNRSLGAVYHVAEPVPGAIPQTQLTPDPGSGLLLAPDGEPAHAQFALVDRRLRLDWKEVVATDERLAVRLVRIDGPLRVTHEVNGVEPDSWSGPQFEYVRLGCQGGELVVLVDSDASLFTSPQTVRAHVEGRVVSRERIQPGTGKAVFVPLESDGTGRCAVTFTVSPTVVPAEADPRLVDVRELGVHVRQFIYVP